MVRDRFRGASFAAALTLALALALVLTGCGASTLSASALRTRASRLCNAAIRRSDDIPLPTQISGGATFLEHGIAVFGPELEQLRKLAPPARLASAYRVALGDSGQQLDALIASDHNLHHGADPVLAIKALEVELGPIDARDQASWRAVGAPACANLAR